MTRSTFCSLISPPTSALAPAKRSSALWQAGAGALKRASSRMLQGWVAVGAALAAYGLVAGSFWIFMLGGFFTGIYMAAQGFFRFAATDCAPPEFQARAISWVMAGGLAAAITGPLLVRLTAEATAIPFLATYAAIIGLNLLGPVLFGFLDIPRPAAPAAGAAGGRPLRALIRVPQIAVAMIWQQMLRADGMISEFLATVFGITPPDWLGDPRLALIAVCMVAMTIGLRTVMTICAVAQISKSARVRRAPGRAKPSSSHSLYIGASRGE